MSLQVQRMAVASSRLLKGRPVVERPGLQLLKLTRSYLVRPRGDPLGLAVADSRYSVRPSVPDRALVVLAIDFRAVFCPGRWASSVACLSFYLFPWFNRHSLVDASSALTPPSFLPSHLQSSSLFYNKAQRPHDHLLQHASVHDWLW